MLILAQHKGDNRLHSRTIRHSGIRSAVPRWQGEVMHATLRDAPQPLSRSVEDYLKVIYHLSAEGGFAATSDIAGMLAD